MLAQSRVHRPDKGQNCEDWVDGQLPNLYFQTFYIRCETQSHETLCRSAWMIGCYDKLKQPCFATKI